MHIFLSVDKALSTPRVQQAGVTLARAIAVMERRGIFVLVALLALAQWRTPHLDPQDWDYDEGINLMKAMLLSRGFALYRDIWSDQPPLLTALLAGWAALFGESVAAMRVLILAFAGLLLWTLYLALRAQVSAVAATVALALLLISEYFLRLSGAVMIGLPALALGATAAALLVTGRRTVWRVTLAGVILALALQTKFIIALIGPALVVELLFGPRAIAQTHRRRLGLIAMLGLATGLTFVLVALPFDALQPGMLLGTHFGTQTWQQGIFVAERSEFLPNFYRQHGVYLALALVGIMWAGRSGTRAVLLPFAWFVTTLLALSIHRPLWYHHVIMLTVPLCWLCAYGVEAWWRAFQHVDAPGLRHRDRVRRAEMLAAVAVAMALTFTMLPTSLAARQEDQMRVNRPNYIPHIFQRFAADARQTPGWVFTDHPFYAYQAGLPVPPPIAAISRKRIETGIITQEDMVRVLEEYAPRYIILERFTGTYSEPFMEIVQARYDLVVAIEPAQYYRLKGNLEAGVLPQ